MRSSASAVLLAVVMASTAIASQSPLSPVPPAIEFEVASIKRNTSDRLTPSGGPFNPTSGQITQTWIPARFIITRAFPDLTTPLEVIGLPGWADTERYDVTVKYTPGATQEQQAQMWRTLLADRMKLQAHYETRERPGYRLVLARPDGKLGPSIKPATECTAADSSREGMSKTFDLTMAAIVEKRALTPQEEQLLMTGCRPTFMMGDTMYAGAVPMELFARLLQGATERTVIDGTGLKGYFSLKFTAARRPAPNPDPDGPPSVFTALPEQLGLKLESSPIQAKILVVDHVERPTQN